MNSKTTTMLSLATVLSLSLGACREQDGATVPPATPAEMAAASDLDRGELYDGMAVPHFDEDGYYELTEVVFLPVDSDPDAPLRFEVDLLIDPTIATTCDMPKPTVKFETDSAEIESRGTGNLARLARCLNEEPLRGDPLQITGHADPRGTAEYNRELGLERADAVAAVLEQHGVNEERLNTYTMGEALASDDPDQWAKDRKVVIALAQ